MDPTNPEAMDMRVVSALLRLGNKYDIPHLRRSMLLRIHAEYPTSIQKAYFDSFIYFVSTDWIHIDAVNLLYHEGIFSPLPLALYFIICLYTTVSLVRAHGFYDPSNVNLELDDLSTGANSGRNST